MTYIKCKDQVVGEVYSLVSQMYVARASIIVRAEKRGGGNIRLVYLDNFLCALPECWQ